MPVALCTQIQAITKAPAVPAGYKGVSAAFALMAVVFPMVAAPAFWVRSRRRSQLHGIHICTAPDIPIAHEVILLIVCCVLCGCQAYGQDVPVLILLLEASPTWLLRTLQLIYILYSVLNWQMGGEAQVNGEPLTTYCNCAARCCLYTCPFTCDCSAGTSSSARCMLKLSPVCLYL